MDYSDDVELLEVILCGYEGIDGVMPARLTARLRRRQSMIRKSVQRFSEKIML